MQRQSDIHQFAHPAEEERDWLSAVLRGQAGLVEHFIGSGADSAWWDAALHTLVTLSASRIGFVGCIGHDPGAPPGVRPVAVTGIAWMEWSRQVCDRFATDGLGVGRVTSGIGAHIATGEMVLNGDPYGDPRRWGLPRGHPPLESYMGIPLRDGPEVIGLVGLANRPGGYRESVEDDLRPVLAIIAMVAGRALAERRASEATATSTRLGSVVAALTRAERERQGIDEGVHHILTAGPLADAERAVAAVVTELDPALRVSVMPCDPDDPAQLRPVAGQCPVVARSDCMALGRRCLHVSLPGIRPDPCPYADPLDAMTICCPVATDDVQRGIVMVHSRDVTEEGPARAESIGLAVTRLADALAEVALREASISRAMHDPLTGLLNRTALLEAAEQRLARIHPSARPFGLLVVDLDDFKEVNDQLGHAVGDEALVAVASALAGAVRGTDLIARIGGDEFVVLLDSADPGVMRAAADRLVDVVSVVTPAAGPGMSASVGGMLVGWGDATWDEMYQRADMLLYRAKAAGKGVAVIGPLLGTPDLT